MWRQDRLRCLGTRRLPLTRSKASLRSTPLFVLCRGVYSCMAYAERDSVCCSRGVGNGRIGIVFHGTYDDNKCR